MIPDAVGRAAVRLREAMLRGRHRVLADGSEHAAVPANRAMPYQIRPHRIRVARLVKTGN